MEDLCIKKDRFLSLLDKMIPSDRGVLVKCREIRQLPEIFTLPALLAVPGPHVDTRSIFWRQPQKGEGYHMVFIIGLLFGGFFIGLGIYQLKTKQFITGGRGSGWVSNANPGALLYIFATLEILVGGASIGLVSHMALQRARTAGHCDHQDDKSECSEYFDDWSSDELARVCGEPALPGPCPHNNLLGSCLIDTGCREVDLTFWPGHGFRGALSTRA